MAELTYRDAVIRGIAQEMTRDPDVVFLGEDVGKPGGVFKATELRQRVLDVLADWAGKPVPELQSSDLDLAVARGAAYYGQVRRGRGVRIRGGVARSYYVGLETSAPAVPGVPPPIKALCVVPMGMEEGAEADVPSSELGLVVGEPAVFRFLSSTTRRDDPVGTVLDRWNPEEIQELAPLETALAAEEGAQGETVPVRLHSNVNEVGTLELWCQSTRDPRRWKLEFNVREPSPNCQPTANGSRSGGMALLRQSRSALRRSELGHGHGQAIGAGIDDSAPWKTEETIIGLSQLPVLSGVSRFGGAG